VSQSDTAKTVTAKLRNNFLTPSSECGAN